MVRYMHKKIHLAKTSDIWKYLVDSFVFTKISDIYSFKLIKYIDTIQI